MFALKRPGSQESLSPDMSPSNKETAPLRPAFAAQPYSLFSITGLSLNLSQRHFCLRYYWDTTLDASSKMNAPIGEKAEVGIRHKK